MTATDDLRLLLDERGVEHTDSYDLTEWLDEQGRTVIATDSVAECRLNDRKMVVRRAMTPEQAITATLGRTTTRNTTRTVYGNKRPVCEVCGYGIGDKRWHFCPSCGAEVVE